MESVTVKPKNIKDSRLYKICGELPGMTHRFSKRKYRGKYLNDLPEKKKNQGFIDGILQHQLLFPVRNP
jgi:hypothetical protein